MKKSEKQLINQLINHGHTFKSDFKNVAKGDWVNKAMQDLDKLGNELKKIMNQLNCHILFQTNNELKNLYKYD